MMDRQHLGWPVSSRGTRHDRPSAPMGAVMTDRQHLRVAVMTGRQHLGVAIMTDRQHLGGPS